MMDRMADATKLANCLNPELEVPICTGTGDEVLAQATYLDAMYESSDFGKTWTKVMTADQLRVPGNNSALMIGILGYGPGIQSWYNNWIAVDPTATDAVTHFPTRLGLNPPSLPSDPAVPPGELGEKLHGFGTYYLRGNVGIFTFAVPDTAVAATVKTWKLTFLVSTT